MMNVNIFDSDLFPYLEGEAIKDSTLQLTIKDLKYEILKNHRGQEEQKPVIYFKENRKGMVLNKTNAKILAVMFGPLTGGWENKVITIHTERVQAFGEVHNALRILPAQQGKDFLPENWQQLKPTKVDFFNAAKSELGLEAATAAAMLKEAGFTNGYDPEAAPDMWAALLNGPMPETMAVQPDEPQTLEDAEDVVRLFAEPPVSDVNYYAGDE